MFCLTQQFYKKSWIWLYQLMSVSQLSEPRVSDCGTDFEDNLSRIVTKPTKWHVRPAKTQISLGIRPVWSESSLCAQWVAKDPSFLHADSEDSDQIGRMPRLIWVVTGRTCHFVGFVTRRLIIGGYKAVANNGLLYFLPFCSDGSQYLFELSEWQNFKHICSKSH